MDKQAASLLQRLGAQMRAVEQEGTADAIHDLRTSIRRLSECLRVFDKFFPAGEARKLRSKLKKVMSLAGEVRNRDIAEELFVKGGMAREHALLTELRAERERAETELRSKLNAWSQADFVRRSRRRLEL